MTGGAKGPDVCGGRGVLRRRRDFVHEMRRGSSDRLEVRMASVTLEGLASEDLGLLRGAQGTRGHAENGAVIIDKSCGKGKEEGRGHFPRSLFARSLAATAGCAPGSSFNTCPTR